MKVPLRPGQRPLPYPLRCDDSELAIYRKVLLGTLQQAEEPLNGSSGSSGAGLSRMIPVGAGTLCT